MKLVTVVHCWSAPRSRSTAFLYSFEARGDDCVAIDEPLYREWLMQKGDNVARPYYQAMIDGVPPADSPEDEDPEQWKRELLSLSERIAQGVEKLNTGGLVFCKHMAKHSFLYDFDNELKIDDVELIHRHILLIRDPVDVLSSWSVAGGVHGDNPTSDEVGIIPLMVIYSKLESRMEDGMQPIVLDSDDLVSDPEGALFWICDRLSIPFHQSMLTWKSGKHKCDGPWARWWYMNVHKSAGWETSTKEYYPETRKYRTMDPLLMPALKASFPAYTFLSQLTMSYLQRGPPPTKAYEDPRNESLLVWIGAPGRGRLLPRDMAGVSPWDSSVQGGDACWEGIRVYRGKILSLDKHLRRLFRSARALGFENLHTKEEVTEAIFRTLAANGMRDRK